jgi:hypothetical protein
MYPIALIVCLSLFKGATWLYEKLIFVEKKEG